MSDEGKVVELGNLREAIENIEHAVFVEALIARKLVELGGAREDTALLFEDEVAEVAARVILEWKCSHGG